MAVRGAALRVGDRAWFAAFPYLPGAEALARELAGSFRELLEAPALERARSLGRARARAAADDPRAAALLPELETAAPEEQYLSFQFARLLLSAMPQLGVLRRFAVAEAKRATERLEALDAPDLLEFGRGFGYALEESAGEFVVPIEQYLRLAAPIRESDFRLVQQRLVRGRVIVSAKRAARLLGEAVRVALAQPLPLDATLVDAVRRQEAEVVRDLESRLPPPTPRAGAGSAAVRADLFPPCIRKMRRTLEAGENLSHAGRFCLAAFLHRVGADFETIVDAFRGAPDFDESITRYQVEHITRHGEGEGYSPPECSTLRSHGLCARDGDPAAPAPADRARDERCFDPRLKHPLQYYEMRGGRTARPVRRPAEAARGTSERPG